MKFILTHFPPLVHGICKICLKLLSSSGNDAIDTAQADLWIETLDKYGISYIAWNLSNKDETSAMLKSGCGKTSGFTQEDLSESGRWVYRMLRKYKGEIGILFGDSTRLAMLVE